MNTGTENGAGALPPKVCISGWIAYAVETIEVAYLCDRVTPCCGPFHVAERTLVLLELLGIVCLFTIMRILA